MYRDSYAGIKKKERFEITRIKL